MIYSKKCIFGFVPISGTELLKLFSSVAQSCPTLCDPMNHSTPGLPVHHQLPELTQTHVHQVSDAIQPSHPLSSPLLPPSIFPSIRSFPMSQFFTSGGQSIGASASVLPMNIQDWFPLGLTGLISLQFKGLSRIFSQHHILKTSILVESALAYLLFYRVRAGMGWRGSVPYYTIWVSIFNPPSHFLGFYMTICFFFALQQNLPHTSFGSPFPQPSFLC